MTAESLLAHIEHQVENSPDVFIGAILIGQRLNLFKNGFFGTPDEAIGFFDFFLLLLIEAGTFAAAFIDAAHFGGIMAGNNHKWRNVMGNAGVACGIAPLADGAELVDGNHTGKPCAGLDVAVAADLRAVAHDDRIAERAVVANVDAYHQQVSAADDGIFVRIHTRMNRYKFADDIIIADHQAAGGLVEIQDLRRTADDAIGEQPVVFANLDIFADHNVGIKNRPIADFSTGINQRERTNHDIIAQLCGFINHRTGVYL